jgi:hypothetical protein
VAYEPGNLSRTYEFLCGGNSTIYANLDGGGASLLGVQVEQTNFEATVMMGARQAVTTLSVKDSNQDSNVDAMLQLVDRL